MVHRFACVLLTTLLATGPPSGAFATTYDDAARREGTCAGGITWRMEAKSDGGRIEIRARIDTRRYGQRWSWVLRHNGSLSDRGTSRTQSDGSYEIERTAIDVYGPDTFRFRATRKAAVCVARVTF